MFKIESLDISYGCIDTVSNQIIRMTIHYISIEYKLLLSY